MTDAGVLHHFGSREALLTAVIQARDTAAAEEYTPETVLWRTELLAENAATRGLVRLFLDIAAASADPDHPGHAFFTPLEPQAAIAATGSGRRCRLGRPDPAGRDGRTSAPVVAGAVDRHDR
jgi:AcrR family transcriptional regulator